MRHPAAVLALALGAAAHPVPDDREFTVLQPGESSLERDDVRGGGLGGCMERPGRGLGSAAALSVSSVLIENDASIAFGPPIRGGLYGIAPPYVAVSGSSDSTSLRFLARVWRNNLWRGAGVQHRPILPRRP